MIPTPPPLLSAMLVLGDQWNLLILQHAFLSHARRFSQWRDILGISESVLTDRLRELVGAGILRTSRYREGHRSHEEYVLTDRGIDLWPLLVCMWAWEEQWVKAGAGGLWLEHQSCQASTMPLLMCGRCGAFPVSARDTDTTDRSDGDVVGGGPRRRHHRRAVRSLDAAQVLAYDAETLAILGDRWSTLVLGKAFLGVTTFGAMRDQLRIAPSVLSERLRLFVERGILRNEPADGRGSRYRLTTKGLSFFPVLAIMWDWADTHLAVVGGSRDLLIVHRGCGHRFAPRLACSACHEPIERRDLRFHDRAEQPRLATACGRLGD